MASAGPLSISAHPPSPPHLPGRLYGGGGSRADEERGSSEYVLLRVGSTSGWEPDTLAPHQKTQLIVEVKVTGRAGEMSYRVSP